MDWQKPAPAPVVETTAERNSYGFCEGRSCADAVQAAFNALGGTIAGLPHKGCF